jgi:hypothetical protein
MTTEFAAHNSRTRVQALNAFRRRKLRVRARQSALAAGLVVLLALLVWPREIGLQTPISPGETTVVSTPSPHSPTPALLNDAELLALFPPGACYIAEVNGEMRLVFRNEAVRARYLN